jgi:hypothetical protein
MVIMNTLSSAAHCMFVLSATENMMFLVRGSKVCAVRFSSSSHQYQKMKEPSVGSVNCLLTVTENGCLAVNRITNQLSIGRTSSEHIAIWLAGAATLREWDHDGCRLGLIPDPTCRRGTVRLSVHEQSRAASMTSDHCRRASLSHAKI